ncbi:hypothetical protein V500_06548 [Pseudogymnoascus sp. VKM F-4518 (FW-2643)]|nr:hypothetical protein V500_06548 [Pseudogymnoascus sp. VKM F-4518 (FW-2643)]
MSGTHTGQSVRGAVNDELERQLNSVGMATGPGGGTVVYLHDRNTEVPLEEIQQAYLLVRSGYKPDPAADAWGRPPAPVHPPGLPAPTPENARLWELIPNSQQSWPAELQEFDQRYALARAPAPTFSVTSAGGPIRRPSPTTQSLSTPAAETTGRRSRGVFVQLGSYFTAEGLRNSVVIFPPRSSDSRSMAKEGEPFPVTKSRQGVAPPGSVFHGASAPAATAPRFVPRATAASFVPSTVAIASGPLQPHHPARVGTSAPPTTFGFSATSRDFLPTVPAAAATGNNSLAVVGPWAPPPTTSVPVSSQTQVIVNLPRAPITVAPMPVPGTLDAASDMRMVVLMGIPAETTLLDISDSISSGLYGAVYSIQFGNANEKRFSQIIFRDAITVDTHKSATPGARGYYTALTAAAGQPWDDRDGFLWPFPRGCEVIISLKNFVATDILRAMRPPRQPRAIGFGTAPPRAPALSRRISLVGRGGLFNYFREANIMKVMLSRSSILKPSVERICVYNSGNATIVFSDVQTAVEAMRRFEDYNRRSPEIKRVAATFSKCPGETSVEYMVAAMYTVYLTNNPH